ncbi:MAG: hypothetical protein II612_03960 [Prevotella sp.]|nr:hypothetical protein [Prevotella sp.]
MNNEMTYHLRHMAGSMAAEWTKMCMDKANEPARMLRKYYSDVTGQKLSMRQTWSLIEAQTAFFLGIMPADYTLVLRMALLAWAVVAVKKCRKLLSANEQ